MLDEAYIVRKRKQLAKERAEKKLEEEEDIKQLEE